jgi:hypothetical protein
MRLYLDGKSQVAIRNGHRLHRNESAVLESPSTAVVRQHLLGNPINEAALNTIISLYQPVSAKVRALSQGKGGGGQIAAQNLMPRTAEPSL